MSKTLLLADDSMTIQKVVELTFMDQDYEVVAVSDGSSALEKLGEVNPDLVIADVHMPGADGYEVCRQTKAASAGTPVLLLVGTFEEFDEGKAASAGADGHLKKPFDSQELLKKVVALVSGEGAAASAPSAPDAEESPELTTQRAVPQPEAPASTPSAPRPASSEPAPPEPAAPQAAQQPTAEATPEPAAPAPPPEVPASVPTPTATPTAGSDDLQSSTAETRPTQARGPEGSPAPGQASENPEPAAPEQAAAAPAPEPVSEEPEPAAAPPEAAPPAASEKAAAAASANGELSDEDVERIARKVIELSGGDAVKEVAWEVIPDLAEVVIRERIAELEADVE